MREERDRKAVLEREDIVRRTVEGCGERVFKGSYACLRKNDE